MRFCFNHRLLFLALLSGVVMASSWEESYVGHSRSGHLDSLGASDGSDFFSIAGNPAWNAKNSGAGITVAGQSAFMGSKISEDSSVGFLGLVAQKNLQYLKFGMLVLMPLGESLLLDTGNVNGKVAPWNTRAKQIHLQPSMGVNFWNEKITLAVAVPISFHTRAEANLNFDDSESNSRFKAGLEPAFSYGVGLWWKLTQQHSLSLYYRAAKSSQANIDTQTSVPLPGDLNVDIEGSGVANYFYEPARVTIQSDWTINEQWRLGLLVRYSLWSKMPPPYLSLSFEKPNLESPNSPEFSAQDSIELGGGMGYQWNNEHGIVAAYQYFKSPFEEAPLYYDSDQHQVGLGYIWRPFDSSYQYQVGGRVHFLESGGLYTYLGIGVGYQL